MLAEVRSGIFLPDATRSGRFPGKVSKPLEVDADNGSDFSYEPSLGFGDAVEEQPIESSDGHETAGSRDIDLVSPPDSLQQPRLSALRRLGLGLLLEVA